MARYFLFTLYFNAVFHSASSSSEIARVRKHPKHVRIYNMSLKRSKYWARSLMCQYLQEAWILRFHYIYYQIALELLGTQHHKGCYHDHILHNSLKANLLKLILTERWLSNNRPRAFFLAFTNISWSILMLFYAMQTSAIKDEGYRMHLLFRNLFWFKWDWITQTKVKNILAS